ncbi:MAG: hypothetical protein ACE5GM_01020 [bacterium]
MNIRLTDIKTRPYQTFAAFYGFCLFLILVSAPLRINLGAHIIRGDGFFYYVYARSLLFDRDLNFKNEYEDFGPVVFGRNLFRPGTIHWPKNWKQYPENGFAMGSGILWLPFLVIAHLLTLLAGAIGFSLRPDGYSLFYECAVGAAACFYSFLASVFLYRIARSRFGESASFWAVISFCTATAWINYVVNESSYCHTAELFTSSLVFWLILRYRDIHKMSYKQAFLLGAAIGLSSLVRWQTVLWGIIPLFLCGTAFFRTPGKKTILIKTMLLSGGAGLIFSPQLQAWKAIFGKYLLIPQGSSYLVFRLSPFWKILFSNNHGLFFWHPITAVAFGGVIWFLYSTSGNNEVLLAGALVFILMVMVNCLPRDWWGNYSFGMRRMICTYPLLVYGLAASLDHKKITETTIFSGWLILTVWNAVLLVLWSFSLSGEIFPH